MTSNERIAGKMAKQIRDRWNRRNDRSRWTGTRGSDPVRQVIRSSVRCLRAIQAHA